MATGHIGNTRRNMNTTPILRCYWKNGKLNVETEKEVFAVDSSEGVKALKANLITLPGETDAVPIFVPDSPRRMTLVQERISGLRD